MNKRPTQGPRSHRTAYKRISGQVRTLISGRELSEDTLGLPYNGASPSANIRKNG